MRDLIALAAIGLGALLAILSTLAFLPRRPGRHSAEFLTELPEPAPVSPWSRPWTGPTKEEAAALFQREAETTLQLRVTHERRRAAALATLGVDYPYTYEGAPFGADAFGADAFAAWGVSA